MSGLSTFADFEGEIRRIISVADERKIPLRILGGAAIRMHCPNNGALYERLGRVPKHDMDFVTYDKFRPLTRRLFVDLGYEPYVTMMMTGATGRHRQIFNDKEGNKAIDVFLGKLEMCHVIDYAERLEVDTPTVPLAELLLQKLQIVQLNEKDLQDSVILLTEHDIGSTDHEEINGGYIAGLLGSDWGFNRTVSDNLSALKGLTGKYPLTEQEKRTVKERIEKLQGLIDGHAKSFQWRMRAKIGASKRWYNVVEEVERD